MMPELGVAEIDGGGMSEVWSWSGNGESEVGGTGGKAIESSMEED